MYIPAIAYHILDKVNPEFIHLAVKCKTYNTD